MGEAYSTIVNAVIDGEPRLLPVGSYSSGPKPAVRVVLEAAG